jgi:hypothetical protein
MTRIKARLAKILERLKSNEAQLKKARRRYKANTGLEQKEKAKAAKFQQQADEERLETGHSFSNPLAADALDRKAARCLHRAHKAHLRSVYWRGKVKLAVQKKHDLGIHQDKIAAELAKWKKEHGVVVEGNKVVGGTPGQRWKAALLTSVKNCPNGKRRNFYSQSGNWDIDHELVGGPEYGHRSDCSSTVTGWAKACGLPDPNGEDFRGGYTGTLVGQHNGWKEVSRSYMETFGHPAYIVYGPGAGHHVEAYLGPGDRTAGHGSAAVDFGIVDDFGDGDLRCYVYEGSGS